MLNTSMLKHWIQRNSKELVDQTAHFVIGAVAVYCMATYGIENSIFILTTFALVREMIQHNDKTVGDGSWLDMLFWTIGAIVGQVFAL